MKSTVKYSATEQHLLVLFPENGQRITIAQLAKKHYRKVPVARVPKYPRQSIAWILRSLTKKVKKNGEPFAVCASKFNGPHEVEYWLQPKNE